MSATTVSMRDALYEPPGPRTRRRTAIVTMLSLAVIALVLVLVVLRFYEAGQLAPEKWDYFLKGTTWSYLWRGLVGTFQVALSAGAIAIVLGIALMFGRISRIKVLSVASRVVIDFFRGVPSLLLIYFFFLVLPNYGFKIPAFWMITLPVALAASGVLAEVFRAGMNAVPKGQTEAALSIGMRPLAVKLKIVLPQALRIVVPSLISQLVVVVKDTTVAYVVSFPDFMQQARVVIATYDALLPVYFVVAIVYILINYALNELAIYVARRSGTQIITRTSENPV